jgi:Glycosyltransferase Family 4/Glycosyl transferases group 1
MSAHATDLPPFRPSPSADAPLDSLPSPTLFRDFIERDEDIERAPARAARPRLGIPQDTQFHVLSFEGPDAYSRIGGLETRVAGLCEALVNAGLETHLWFVGQPDLPGHERRDGLHLHRWCQWLSQYHPRGVYDGEQNKVPDYAGSLPPVLFHDVLAPHLAAGGRAVVMAEEWQTADALLHLDHLLRGLPANQRSRVRLFWNANNVFGFDRVDFTRLRSCALVTTVSRYMKQLMQTAGVEAVVLPNGLSPDAYLAPDRTAVHQLRKMFAGRIAITKMARWDPDKNWLGSIDIIAHMKQLGLRPLLIARGGLERHGIDVLRAMHRAGLRVAERDHAELGLRGLVQALSDTESVDVLHVTRHVDRDSRRALFRASDVVLANSAMEPFGLVGLEAMAVGGIGCTGLTGEDYVMPGRNALVLQTSDPSEFVKLYMPLRADPEYEAAMRRAGRATARQYAWPEVIRTALAPRLGLSRCD